MAELQHAAAGRTRIGELLETLERRCEELTGDQQVVLPLRVGAL